MTKTEAKIKIIAESDTCYGRTLRAINVLVKRYGYNRVLLEAHKTCF